MVISLLKRTTSIAAVCCLCSICGTLSSCSEETTETSEYDNWQQRNELFFTTLEDSLRSNPSQWMHIKNYSLDATTEGKPTDYIYAKVIAQGTETESPLFTDSVRVIYQGRLIPSASYPDGYIFSTTVSGRFDIATGYSVRQSVSNTINGYSTALQHMHRGDHWRIFIPHQLGYGQERQTSSSGTLVIPAYSTLIYDLILIDFSSAGEVMPQWSSRQR
ncbi:MAG: FKBP-type peptidyl-prolyl cis-trans isomerase [Prevotella sp.]|nr:FKBP-type peptidyl-prolyl cis-trans isomerase [Prevotella sp.]